MGTTTVKWIQGKQYIGIGSTQQCVVLSTPAEGIGIKPLDLLLIAVAACSAVDVVDILAKKRMPCLCWRSPPAASRIRTRRGPFRKLHLHFRVGGKKLTQPAVAQAIQLAEEKYCSVAATVRATAQVTTDFEIVEEAPIAASMH